MYAATNGYAHHEGAGGVYRTVNGGGSWQPFSQGLTNRFVLTFAIDSTGHVLYAGTQGGVFGLRGR